jgi:hypothetical protein
VAGEDLVLVGDGCEDRTEQSIGLGLLRDRDSAATRLRLLLADHRRGQPAQRNAVALAAAP